MSEDEGTENEENESEEEEETFTKADRDKLMGALKKERAEKKALEKYLTPEERKSARSPKPSDMPGAKTPKDDRDTEDAARKIEEQIEKARLETEDRFRPLIARSAARAALASAGASGSLSKMVRMLDLSELDISDDGEVEGLEEQIDELKKEFPALFRHADETDDDLKPRRRRSVGSADGGRGKTPPRKSASEIQAKALGY